MGHRACESFSRVFRVCSVFGVHGVDKPLRAHLGFTGVTEAGGS